MSSSSLHSAFVSKNADEVEDALDEAFSEGLSSEMVPILCSLLLASWHQRHEDIALALKDLKHADAVPALLEASNRTYDFYYDDGLALIRKCTWALADIGTSNAKEALLALANSSNKEVNDYATKRLANWESEIGRKGT